MTANKSSEIIGGGATISDYCNSSQEKKMKETFGNIPSNMDTI